MSRRQRREAAKASSSATSANPDVPLARPPPPLPRKSKTLYEIAAERQAELSKHGQPFPRSSATSDLVTKELHLRPNGTLSETPPLTASPLTYTSTSNYPVSSSASDPDPSASSFSSSEYPILDTVFTSLTLSILHFTLSFLAAHQYAQSINYPHLAFETCCLALPILTFLIHLVHGHIIYVPYLFVPEKSSSASLPKALQALFLLSANVSGCRLIELTNDAGYYAVMKKAPAIGVLWVWSVLELGLAGALGGVMGPAIFAWWRGYGIW